MHVVATCDLVATLHFTSIWVLLSVINKGVLIPRHIRYIDVIHQIVSFGHHINGICHHVRLRVSRDLLSIAEFNYVFAERLLDNIGIRLSHLISVFYLTLRVNVPGEHPRLPVAILLKFGTSQIYRRCL